MDKWIIRDWAGNDMNLLGRKEFNNFGDARDEISVFATGIADRGVTNGKYKQDSEAYHETINGIEEDLYAINIDENGNELPDNGQYSY